MKEKKTIKSAIPFILQSLKPYRKLIVLLHIISVIWAINLSLRPFLLKLIVDRIPEINATNIFKLIGTTTILYVLLSFVNPINGWFYGWARLRLRPNLKKSIRLNLMEWAMQHSYHFYQNQFAGSLANKVNDVASGISIIVQIFIDRFFAHGLALGIASYTLWSTGPRFALILLCWVVLFSLVSLRFSKSATAIAHFAAETKSAVVGSMVDVLTNMASVRLFSGETSEIGYLEGTNQTSVEAEQKRDWFFTKINSIQGFSFALVQIICLIWLIKGVLDQSIKPGDFLLVISVNGAIMDCLWEITYDIIEFADAFGNITQGLETIYAPLEIKDRPGAKELVVSNGTIEFNGVEFHYKGTNLLFQNLSVTIGSGEKVGLVGYSGSGKTTFVNLILRLFDVTQGCILIDEQDIKSVTQASLRKAISMIPQDPSLFHRTLMENIRYGRMEASDEEVVEAARRAQADEFISTLPEGYQSLVGERGIKLSGGQRQRIAIARAILKNAPILMLDEATSQLDSVTEVRIQKSMWELMQRKTTLVVAHRLSTLLHMDRILVFHKGKIIQDGSHTALLTNEGLYKILWNTQIGGFLPQMETSF